MANGLQYYNNVDSGLKAHSSALTNERISALITLYDEAIINAKLKIKYENTEKALVYLKEIWKSFRPLVRSNNYVRKTLNLNTCVRGVYLPDVVFSNIEEEILKIKLNKCFEKISVLVNLNKLLENLEIIVRDIIQEFRFTFRPDVKTTPDIHEATEEMQKQIDKKTEEELLKVVGINNKINWSDYAKRKIFEEKKQ